MIKKFFVILFVILVVCIFITSSSVLFSKDCDNYFGVLYGDVILDELPDDVFYMYSMGSCSPRSTSFVMSDGDGFGHLIYFGYDYEVKAHKYYCNKITDKYYDCDIFKEHVGLDC